MRKTFAVMCVTGALTFGGAGIANATAESGPAPSSTTTVLADDNNSGYPQNNDDKTGLWGLVGLLGLGGLAGLIRRKPTHTAGPAATPGTTPGAGPGTPGRF